MAAPAQGDILYRNATVWVRLPAGTDGQVLTTHGAGSNPTWETSSSSGTDYVVLSNGVQPPTPVDDGSGNFIYVGYTP